MLKKSPPPPAKATQKRHTVLMLRWRRRQHRALHPRIVRRHPVHNCTVISAHMPARIASEWPVCPQSGTVRIPNLSPNAEGVRGGQRLEKSPLAREKSYGHITLAGMDIGG